MSYRTRVPHPALLRLWDGLSRLLHHTPSARRRPPRRAPALEQLEDRTVPTVNQWASQVLAFSSQYQPVAWSANQALGVPNVSGYGDIPAAWAPSRMNGTQEFLTLAFETPVYANGATVRETWGNGFVRQLDLIDVQGNEHTVWSGVDPSAPGAPVDFTVSFETTRYLVRSVRVHIDTSHNLGAYEEVDAVQLLGTLTPPNDPPSAADDAFALDEDFAFSANVLANDTDPDGDALTAALLRGPSHGTLVLNADGSFTYTPVGDFHGEDSFTYAASDGHDHSDVATVTLTVRPVNDAPTAGGASFQTGHATPVSGSVADRAADVDGDALTFKLDSAPAGGTVVVNADGTFTYTPAAGFAGTDRFRYRVDDGKGGSATAEVTVEVAPAANRPPVAVADRVRGLKNQVLVGNVLRNDSDPDGDALTVRLASGPGRGKVVLTPDGRFTYTPQAGFAGTDSFTYAVSDGRGGTATGTVTVVVVNPSDLVLSRLKREQKLVLGKRTTGFLFEPPVRKSLTVVAVNGTGSLVGRDVVLASGARLRINADGSFKYQPPTGRAGATDRFSVTVSDGFETAVLHFTLKSPSRRS